jgi:acyl-CoA dehydrogenase
MDFNLSEEQIAFRDVVRRWVNEELPKDLMRKLEADEENYPFEIWDKLKAHGFSVLASPKNGAGLAVMLSPR